MEMGIEQLITLIKKRLDSKYTPKTVYWYNGIRAIA